MEPTALRNIGPASRTGVFFGYVAAVCLLALALTLSDLIALPDVLRTAPPIFWLLAALAISADVWPLRPGPGRISPVYPSICLTFTILLLCGLGAAVSVQVAAVLASAIRAGHRPWRAMFNSGQYAISFAAASAVLWATDGLPLTESSRSGWRQALIALAAAGAWFAVNYLLVTVVVWLRFGDDWWTLIGNTLGYELLATGALLMLAPLLVGASPALVPFVLVPLYAVNRMARLSAQQSQLARLDPLTGLANRKALSHEVREHIAEQLAPDARHRGTFALLVLDLNRFKHVNDALGHTVGDRLLVEVACRLSAAARPGDLVARLGGDEFAIVAPRLSGVSAAVDLAKQVAGLLTVPVTLDGMSLDIGGSIGVAVYPDHGPDFATLMRHADVAMYDAKNRGDTVAVYLAESDHNSAERLSLLADLRRALEATPKPGHEEIAFYYQPQVELATGEVIGVEALLRWQHPVRGPIDPEELIRVAEHTGVMRLLTLRVIDDVVAQLARWEAEGLRLRAALNVSVRDLHTGEVVDRLADRLVHHGVSAERVQLEITEGALMADPNRVLATLRRLEALGVALSLDDFGTGYSSMQHLRRLPLAEVKIDRSFVLGMAGDLANDPGDDEAIVRSIIELSGALGLRVVAEGVEDERTFQRLASMGCEVAQGWFYARPMPADQLATWLTRYRPLDRLAPTGTI